VLTVIYYFGYLQAGNKIRAIRKSISDLEAIAEYSIEYEGYRSKITNYQARLPFCKDRDYQLFDFVRKTAEESEIKDINIGRQEETESGEMIVQNREVSAVASFHQAGKWIASMENAPFFVKITLLTLKRNSVPVGTVQISLQLSTMFIKGR